MAILKSLLVCMLCGLMMANPSWGQSVVNGGFETLSDLPSNTGQWSLAVGWSNASSAVADPDVYHVGGIGGGDLPETPVAIVAPFQGMAIAGFMASGTPGANRREYLTGTFSESLIPGVRYRMTWSMTNGSPTIFSLAGYGVNGLGIHFSEGSLNQTDLEPLDVIPAFSMTQVFYDREWQEVAYSFTAHEPATHFTCGLFGVDAMHAMEIHDGSNPQMAYYFVDAFQIEIISTDIEADEETVRGPSIKPQTVTIDLDTEASWFVPNAFTPNQDGENDWFKPVLSNLDLVRFDVFSRWGELLWNMEAGEDRGWDGNVLGAKQATPGMYIWKLEAKELNGTILTRSGSINLIR